MKLMVPNLTDWIFKKSLKRFDLDKDNSRMKPLQHQELRGHNPCYFNVRYKSRDFSCHHFVNNYSSAESVV